MALYSSPFGRKGTERDRNGREKRKGDLFSCYANLEGERKGGLLENKVGKFWPEVGKAKNTFSSTEETTLPLLFEIGVGGKVHLPNITRAISSFPRIPLEEEGLSPWSKGNHFGPHTLTPFLGNTKRKC